MTLFCDTPPCRSSTVADFDGDGSSDIGVYRPSTGMWYLSRSTAGPMVVTWGLAADVPVPADYDGDRKADVAAYRPSTGHWWMARSTAGVAHPLWGEAGDIPLPTWPRPGG